MEFLWSDSWFSQALGYDKYAHAAGAALWFCLLWRVLQGWRRRQLARPYRLSGHRRRDLQIVFCLVMAGGLGLELWQDIFSPYDMVANALGAALAASAIGSTRR